MAISESDCPRLPPNEAVTVPILKNGEELPQVLLDFRTAQIYKWKSALILYDSTLSTIEFVVFKSINSVLNFRS